MSYVRHALGGELMNRPTSELVDSELDLLCRAYEEATHGGMAAWFGGDVGAISIVPSKHSRAVCTFTRFAGLWPWQKRRLVAPFPQLGRAGSLLMTDTLISISGDIGAHLCVPRGGYSPDAIDKQTAAKLARLIAVEPLTEKDEAAVNHGPVDSDRETADRHLRALIEYGNSRAIFGRFLEAFAADIICSRPFQLALRRLVYALLESPSGKLGARAVTRILRDAGIGGPVPEWIQRRATMRHHELSSFTRYRFERCRRLRRAIRNLFRSVDRAELSTKEGAGNEK